MVRAFGLHPKGRGFESLSGHMFEEKYTNPNADYFASRIVKSITGMFFSYPEFRFLLKILLGFATVGIAFYILRGVFSQ